MVQQSGYDYLIVNGEQFTGDLEGIVVTSENNVITMTVNSDPSVSSGYVFGWTVSCGDLVGVVSGCIDAAACATILVLTLMMVLVYILSRIQL